MRRICLTYLLFLLLTGCAPQDSDEMIVPIAIDFSPSAKLLSEPTAALKSETWHIHRVDRYKLGNRWTRTWSVGDNIHRIAVDSLEIPRFGQLSRQTIRSATLEAPQGQLQRFASERRADGQSTTTLGVIQAGTLHVQTSTGNNRRQSEFEWPPSAGGYFAIEDSLHGSPMKPGERREILIISPVQTGVTKTILVAQDWESRQNPEAQQHHATETPKHRNTETPTPGYAPINRVGPQPTSTQQLKIESLDPADRVLGIYWQNKSGDVVSYEDTFLSVQTSAATALEAHGPNNALDFDVAVLASVPLEQPLEDWETSRTMTFRVSHPDINPASLFPNGAYQRVESIDPQTAIVTVTMPSLQDDASRPTEFDVRPNRWLASDNPKVEAFALAAVGEAYQPAELAEKLHRHTFATLEKTALGKQFATATETLANRRGDCTEHAMLLAAASRNRNIPARVALGLVYDHPNGVFVYHMWNELWLDNRWVPFDAMGESTIPHAARLKLTTSDLQDISDLGMVAPILTATGGLSIKVGLRS